jgi:hypothetical protein
MQRSVLVLVCVLVVLGGSPLMGSAWDEPTGFRDIPWGTSPAAVKAALPQVTCTYNGTSCAGDMILGGWALISVYITFGDHGMDAVSFTFATKHFDTMVGAFVERYGEPTTRESHPVQNRMGATFVNDELHWQGERVTISLSKYGTNVTESSATLLTKEAIERETLRSQQNKAKARDALGR